MECQPEANSTPLDATIVSYAPPPERGLKERAMSKETRNDKLTVSDGQKG